MPQILTRDCLSAHDQDVLDAVFNPLELTSTIPGQGQTAISVDAGADLVDIEPENPDDLSAVQQSKQLELDAVKLAELGQLDEALDCFAKALSLAPTRPSVHNNRAQALRLADRDDEALADLNKAIELCARELRTKCHALCQRGVLHRKREQLDEARKDFEEAATMGSQFAKKQLVEINPLAALCNQMLRQAFEQLK